MLRAFREVGGVWIFKPVGRAQARPATALQPQRPRTVVWLARAARVADAAPALPSPPPQGKGIFLVNKPSQVEAWLRDRAVRRRNTHTLLSPAASLPLSHHPIDPSSDPALFLHT